MSNPLAIAAVTRTLRNILETGLQADDASVRVTTLPPDKAHDDPQHPNRVNLFLYQAGINSAWRNQDMPGQVRPGESGTPPLPLNLYYLVTAYGEAEVDGKDHLLLGRAMSLLHDHPLLNPQEIRDALPGNDLYQQIERVRITPFQMSVEEVGKLWGAFMTQYRISACYEVRVVLIESTLPVRSALPVLKRGSQDRGVFSSASPSPTLTEALPPPHQPSVRLGDTFTLVGESLDADQSTVRFTSQRLPAPIDHIAQAGAAPGELQVTIDDTNFDPQALATWTPGLYTIALVVQRPNLPSWMTNEVPFALSPTISVAPLNAVPGDLVLTLTCRPRLRPEGQRVLLLFGESQVLPQTINTPGDPLQPTTLTFLVPAVAKGSYVVRLRVDGIDSLPTVLSGSPARLDFDPAQRVIVQ